MNRFLKLLSLCLFLTLTVPLQAVTNGVANEPDSVYLFSYSHADGSGGLKLAWSPDGNRWFSVAEGSSFVNSDFGPWGQMKRMLKPHLMQTRADDRWHCIWELTESGNSLAYVESPDLLQWKAQKYFDRSRLAEYRPAEVYPNVRKEVLLNGTVQQGWMQRVPYATVQRVISFAEHKKYRQALHAERTEQDPVRFAGLKPVEATIEVETECAKTISKHLIGIFFEDINYAADGGLYAELKLNEKKVVLEQETGYPWNGDIRVKVAQGNLPFTMNIRIPGWVRGSVLPSDLYSYADDLKLGYRVLVNGEEVTGELRKGYLRIDRKWKKGDVVEVHFDMQPRVVKANEKVVADRGRVAVERGPIVYCAEWADNDFNIQNIILNRHPKFQVTEKPELLYGINEITTEVQALGFDAAGKLATRDVTLTLIPYYAWAHRGEGKMDVWLPVNRIDVE